MLTGACAKSISADARNSRFDALIILHFFKEKPLSYAETILPEFDQEMAMTRRVLERVPEDKLDWRAALYLVRPDGYVALATARAEPELVRHYLHQRGDVGQRSGQVRHAG